MKVGDKVLLKYTALKGKHKIQDRWENVIYEVIKHSIGKVPVFKNKSMEGDDEMKVVHQNLLLPLYSNPSDHTNALDTESLVDQTVNAHGVIAASTVTSHLQNKCAYSRAQIASLFQQGLQFVTAVFE